MYYRQVVIIDTILFSCLFTGIFLQILFCNAAISFKFRSQYKTCRNVKCFWWYTFSINPVLEMAGRIVAKCDQTLVWAMKFFPKDRPENEFGRPNLGRGYRMFSAYLRSISEINIFKTDQRTWGNKIVFLPMGAAIILTGSLRFSATCCLILFSKKTFSRTRLTL